MAKFRVPHTLVLLFGIMIMAMVLAYILPQGEFDRVENQQGREQVVPGSYEEVESGRLSPLRLFTAIPEGFAAAQDIIFFIFLIGGTFGVLRATGAADAMIGVLLRSLSKKPELLIAGGVFLFAAGSSTIGMAEEYLPFVPILLALCIGLGFDSMTAIGILCVGYGTGYGVAIVNPFTVIIAQGVAEVQPTSGIGYRLLISIPFVAIAIHHVWRYARKVRMTPSSSLVADIEVDPAHTSTEYPDLNWIHGAILGVTGIALVVIIYGLSELSGWHWYIGEMGAMFVGLAIVYALITHFGGDKSSLSMDEAAVQFCKGAAELTTTALLVGFARSILVILEDGHVIDTIVHGIAMPLQLVGASAASIGMLVVQSVCNVFIPSGSGQAYVTMPIMAPLADLVGVTRQTAVLAFQFGDGFTNILVPTNPVLIGILTMAGIPYDRWLRFVLPFLLKIWLAAVIALIVAVQINYT
ncbi:MAG: AbgT family transporter [Rhodothermia bacterium]|nr:AbgT family transporter [Rhodothermia bacterium]